MTTKQKLATYAILPILGASLLGISTVSAMGNPNATPDEVATMQSTRFQDEAALLGISVDEVKNAWAEGKDIRTLAKEKGITDAQLQAKMQEKMTAKMKTELATLVSKGVVTQAQADKRLTAMATKMTEKKGKGMGHGMRMGGMFGGI